AAAIATFELDDGAVFSYRGNWISAGFPTSYDSAWRISGADGTAVWDSFGAPACGPKAEGAENLGTLAMVFAAIRSAEERRAVALREIVGGDWPPPRAQ